MLPLTFHTQIQLTEVFLKTRGLSLNMLMVHALYLDSQELDHLVPLFVFTWRSSAIKQTVMSQLHLKKSQIEHYLFQDYMN